MIEQQELRQNFEKDGRFYIYGEIDETIPENIVAPLIGEIFKRQGMKDVPPIDIFISSYGGYVTYALDIIEAFVIAKTAGVEINTIVTSNACSAASLIAVCGHNRYVGRLASHLLHFSKQYDYSHNPEMAKRNLEYTEFINEEMIKIYQKHTKIKDIKKKLLADNYMILGGKELIKQGLADKLLN